MNRSQTGGYVLKFVSGKYQGGEFPLDLDSEIEIGRGGELDMVLVEDMVSRRHAKITSQGHDLFIEDFGSTNGTFVNGEKIEGKEPIKEGDRILIGTNIIKLVHRDNTMDDAAPDLGSDAVPPSPGHQQGETAPPPSQSGAGLGSNSLPSGSGPGPDGPTGPQQTPGRQAANRTMAAPAINSAVKNPPQQPASPQQQAPPAAPQAQAEPPSAPQQQAPAKPSMGGSISGLIEEVPLPDLLQLFSTSRKSGVLVIMNGDVGKVYLREGRVYFATINDDHELDPYKAFYRLIAWNQGTFSLEAPSDESFENEIDESVESLMMEGMRILDEMKNLGPEVPDMTARVELPQPLTAPLTELEDEKLQTFQMVLNHDSVSDVLNKNTADDVKTMENLVYLIRNDYVVTSDHE